MRRVLAQELSVCVAVIACLKVTQVRLCVRVLRNELLVLAKIVGGLVNARAAVRIVVKGLYDCSGSVGHDVRAVQVVWQEVPRARPVETDYYPTRRRSRASGVESKAWGSTYLHGASIT